MLEMGLDTFGDVGVDSNGGPETQAQALRNVVAEAVLAEQVASTASALESTIARISPFPRQKLYWRPSLGRPSGYFSARQSRS